MQLVRGIARHVNCVCRRKHLGKSLLSLSECIREILADHSSLGKIHSPDRIDFLIRTVNLNARRNEPGIAQRLGIQDRHICAHHEVFGIERIHDRHFRQFCACLINRLGLPDRRYE